MDKGNHYEYSAEVALERLKEGNRKYVTESFATLDISRAILKRFRDYGQHPYAIVITCSDSRVIPEMIFRAGIGDLFVIRLAGNVIDDHQLGSIEYAADHLGTGLVVVLGHTHCGAINAVLQGHSGEYIRYIAEDIQEAIGDEKDPYTACRKNVEHCCKTIERSIVIQKDEQKYGLRVVGAIYDIETGEVVFY